LNKCWTYLKNLKYLTLDLSENMAEDNDLINVATKNLNMLIKLTKL